MGSNNEKQAPKVVIVKHYRSSAREFIAWFKIVVVSGVVILVAFGYLYDRIIPGTIPAQPVNRVSALGLNHSKYKDCDRYPPGTSGRMICENMERERERQRDWDKYRKTQATPEQSRFAECDKFVPRSAVRQICEENAAADRAAKKNPKSDAARGIAHED